MKSAFLRSLACLTSVLAFLGASCEQESTPETLFTGEYDQAEMDAAIEAAKASVDHFIAVLQSGEAEDVSIKVEINDGEQSEFFWTSDVDYADGIFTAKIGNEAGMVEGVKMGDMVKKAKGEISDWLYLKDGLMHGNYTMRVMLPVMDPVEAEMWESRMAPLPE